MGDERANRRSERLAGVARERERRGGLHPIGMAAARLAAANIARSGGGALGRLKAEWAAVAGAELADSTWPEALGRDGALKLRVASTVALELQHRAPLVIERINLFFGHAVVARLVLVQGPLPLPVATRSPSAAPLTTAEETALDARLAGIEDPDLHAALAGLGRLVLAGARRG